MKMLSFLISGLALLLALIGSAALAPPPQPGTNNDVRSFHADHDDHWAQVP
jgi:hypothetical protein